MRCDRCNAPLIEIDHYGERLTASLSATCGKVASVHLWLNCRWKILQRLEE
jgi:hypothetical protein